mmetsp:Transcript_102174/g.266653  ORF Transcript_102174/g.266653 Transcript_102174/m.266653 type:complete len:83 (+) Transcript_102174:311-559(+)
MLTVYNYARLHNVTFCASPWNSRLDHKGDGSALFRFIGGHLYGPPPKDSDVSNSRKISQKCNQGSLGTSPPTSTTWPRPMSS